MKRSKQNQKAEVETEKEETISQRTREKYRKEIVESKETRKIKSSAKEKGDGSEEIQGEDNSVEATKFSELKKYLLSDLSGKAVKNSSPVKKESTEKNRFISKENMIDTREELSPSPVKNPRQAKNKTLEKAEKKPHSSSKKLPSPNVKQELQSTENPVLMNKKQKSPTKCSKTTPSPEKLSVTAIESPRTGSRQRSPNLKYADDMVLFALKSPTKRQIFKKENSTPEKTNNNDVTPTKESLSTESQTSQLYSLLTGVVKTVPKETLKTPKLTEIEIKNESVLNSSNDLQNESENLEAIDNDNKSCGNQKIVTNDKPDDLQPRVVITEEVEENVSRNTENDDEKKNKEAENSEEAKKGNEGSPLQNLSKVIDQIILESTQEEMPGWAVYKSKPPKVRRAKRTKSVGMTIEDKGADGDVGYTVVETRQRGSLGTPASSGDEDDAKGKRRVTKPISKRSIIRMSPALGLLVGHDEDGFTMFDEKKSKSDIGDTKKDEVVEGNSKSNLKADVKKGQNKTKVKKEPKESTNVDDKAAIKSKLLDRKVPVSNSPNTVLSVSKPNTTQSQMKLLGNGAVIHTKATIVSGNQTLPCVLVSNTSNLKPQSFTIPRPSLSTQGSIIVPANRISLISTPCTKLTPSTIISPSTTTMSPMVAVNVVPVPGGVTVVPSVSGSTANVRPIQMVTSLGQPVSMIRAPNVRPGTIPPVFRLASVGPLISTPVRPGANSLLTSTVVTSSSPGVSGPPRISNPAASSVNLPMKSKVLILKKSDMPTSTGPILVSSPQTSGIRPGMSLLKKVPVTTGQNKPVIAVATPIETEKETSANTQKTKQDQKPVLTLEHLISKVKNNIDSLLELPECLVSNTFMDSVMIDKESEASESDNESLEQNTDELDDNSIITAAADDSISEVKMKEPANEKNEEYKNDIGGEKKKDVCIEPQSLKVVTLQEGDKHILNQQPSIEKKGDNQNRGNETMECDDEINSSEKTENENINENDEAKDQNDKATKNFDSKLIPAEHVLKDKSEAEEPVKGQSISLLENKLKKAMESLSNVKSVLAAKTDTSKLLKLDLKTELPQVADKEHLLNEQASLAKSGTDGSVQKEASQDKVFRASDDGKSVMTKESETLCGNNSENEDHLGDSGKRRNIFDVIMEDYHSPNKEGKKSDIDGEKEVIEVQDSPIKKNLEIVEASKTSSEKCLVNTPQLGNEHNVQEDLSDVKGEINNSEEKEDFMMSHNSQNNAVVPLVDKNIPKNDNVSPVNEVIMKTNENLVEISDEKNQPKDDTNTSPKLLTIADKLLAKFKDWDDDGKGGKTLLSNSPVKSEAGARTPVGRSPAKSESGRKTPLGRSPIRTVNKPPIKLKICSSPDKSYRVTASGNITNVGRPVPKHTTQQAIKEPLPMNILSRPEREVKDKLVAFSSQTLDTFLKKLEDVDINLEEDDDENEEVDYDSDMSMDEHEPDFDEIDGILFMSFPSKNALKAHVQVERRTKLGSDDNLLLGMTRMRNMRRKQGYVLSKYHRKVGNKFFKDQDNINQNLRGMHKTLAKYQRLYKQELYWLQNPEEGAATHKTNDITKIKGWKNKIGNVTDDVELAKAEIENGGKLHWRTEARLAKNLRPDELKEYGLNIKKKRRKNIIYTQRKGMSKGDRSQKTENGQELEYSRSNSNDMEIIDGDENETPYNPDDVVENGEGLERTVIFDPDDDVQDEELVRINEREMVKEDETKKNTERHRMFIKSQTLKKRLGYNLRDIQVIRKLGGHNIRRRKNADGVFEGDYMVMDNNSRPSTPDISQSEDTERETPQKKNRKTRTDVQITILTANMIHAACTALPKEFVQKKPPGPSAQDTDTTSKSSDPGQSMTCDKPDTRLAKSRCCRYGCICHLCVFTEQSPEADPKVVKCEKEYCRLGCICDSIEARKEKEKKPHCGKSECMIECYCEDLKADDKQCNKGDDDYRFNGPKKNDKFATLPRRESTYRLAKNLDAVSRKAKLYYESSEMFVDQKGRRRRSKESGESAPQVYMDIDGDEIDIAQVTPGTSKIRKQDITKPISLTQKPVSIKPTSKPASIKSKPSARNSAEMTDFSNIRTEISSQGNWNLSDLSDEYEDVDQCSDKDSDVSTCARSTVYKAVKRDKHLHHGGCTCHCEKKPHGGLLLGMQDVKFNIPDDILSSGKWHTQWICLRSKGQPLEESDPGGLRLLEVISNCNYEDSKAKILSRLTSHISRDSYPKLKRFIVGSFEVKFLPKSDKPAVIPPEVKAKLPKSVYSIRIQIVKDPEANSGIHSFINLIGDDGDPRSQKISDMKPVTSGSETKLDMHTSELAKHLTTNEKIINTSSKNTSVPAGQIKLLGSGDKVMTAPPIESQPITSVTSSGSIVPGGISGLSRLQITRPAAPLTIVPQTVPGNPASNNLANLSGGQIVNIIPNPKYGIGSAVGGTSGTITVPQPISVIASGGLSTTSVTTAVNCQSFPGYTTKGVPLAVSSFAPTQTTILGTYSSLETARNQLSNIVNSQMIRPRFGIVPTTCIPDSQNLKRKVPEELLVSDPKKSKLDSLVQSVPNVVPIRPLMAPVPSVDCTDNSIGQISVLRCVRCNVILTADDITSWVLSQESVQEKICVKCRNSQMHTNKTTITTTSLPPTKTTTKTSPIVIDIDELPNLSKVTEMEIDRGKDLVETVEKEAKKIKNIMQEVAVPQLDLDCEADSREVSQQPSESSKIDLKAAKGVINLSDDESNSDSVKVHCDKKSPSEEEDELEAAIRDAQDDFDNMARNLSDENESQEDEENTDFTKSNVIVIDDDDEDNDTGMSIKRKTNEMNLNGPSAKRSKEQSSNDEDEEVDITTYSENDPIDISQTVNPAVRVPTWHSSSCSLHSHLMRKKRKPQLDLIENKQINEIEIREGCIKMDVEEYRKSKLNKERNRRSQMRILYKQISTLVMTQQELSALKNYSKISPHVEILDKALEYIRVERLKTPKLESKVKAFRQYQDKLKHRLQELKKYHIDRGISKEKLDFQLDKIAVVCDKIYEHLPEIKKHIKSKKEQYSTTSTPSPVALVKNKTNSGKQVKQRSRLTTSKKRNMAEIYIDNPEEYRYERRKKLAPAATPLVSLPGSYVKVMSAGSGQNTAGASHIQPTLVGPVVNIPGTNLLGVPVPITQVSNIPGTVVTIQGTNVVPVTGTLDLQSVGIGMQSVGIRVQGSNPVRFQSPNTAGLSKAHIAGHPSNAISRNRGKSASRLQQQGDKDHHNMVQSPQSFVSLNSDAPQCLEPSSSAGPQHSALYSQSSFQTPPSELSKILSTPSGFKNLGQHPSTSAFSDVIGQIIKKNIAEDCDLATESTPKSSDSQTSSETKKYVSPIPQYDVNMLKDQILDDATGELISVVINDEDNQNDNSSESSQSNENDNYSFKQNKTGKESSEIALSDEMCSVEKTKDDFKEQKKAEAEDETNIESLLDDIKSLCGDTKQQESPKLNLNSSGDIRNDNDSVKCVFPGNKTDQVDGDLFNLSGSKDQSESDSNNSARTNPYMEDSDGNGSLVGDINDDLGDLESNTPKIVSVMSIADVFNDGLKSSEASPSVGPQGDNDSLLISAVTDKN